MLEKFDFGHPDAFFARFARAAYEARGSGRRRMLSIGAGNCDTEVRLAQSLVDAGCHAFLIECMDINGAMLERGRNAANEAGLAGHVLPIRGDFNRWVPEGRYDAIIANQSLHHVLELEHLFDAVHAALEETGRFIVSDMIGRNGHRRWPEAKAIIDAFWGELPESHRYNRQLRRKEAHLEDWDCSVAGFEGIRAEDILPLLCQRFEFDLFLGFGNLIEPFVGRAFGHNFDAGAEWDRAFIDKIHARDEAELCSGRIKPTQMLAVMRVGAGGAVEHLPGRAPAASIRWPDLCRRANSR
jgi:SAM-dependent methyltransferase